MPARVLAIGDPHCQVSTLSVFKMMAERTRVLAEQERPDAVVILGDTNHTHAMVHSTTLNTSYEWILALARVCPVYLLIGNHDLVAPSQFLTSDHPFKVLKGQPNVTVVDRPLTSSVSDQLFAFCPYVPMGRLAEALDLAPGWQGASAVFAHPDIEGAKMSGSMVCTKGDRWAPEWPLLVAGHYHDRQRPLNNVLYVGTPFHHTFGETAEKFVSLFTFEGRSWTEETYSLGLPRKVTLECSSVSEIPTVDMLLGGDQYRLRVTDSFASLVKFKKSAEYRALQAASVKIVLNASDVNFTPSDKGRQTYLDSLSEMVMSLGDAAVETVFRDVTASVEQGAV